VVITCPAPRLGRPDLRQVTVTDQTELRNSISDLVSLAVDQSEALADAVRADRADSEMQERISNWRCAKGDYKDGGWFPATGTAQLVGTFRPAQGCGTFDTAFQRANALAMESTAAHHFLPLLKSLHDAHHALLSNACQVAERSQDVFASADQSAAVHELALAVGLYLAPGGTPGATGGAATDGERSDDAGEFQPGQWFTLNTRVPASRLRQASRPARKTKIVRTRIINGVKCYSVSDVKRWWSGDMEKA